MKYNDDEKDELIHLCNQEEEFRKMVLTLLSSEDSEVFDSMTKIAGDDNPEQMMKFIKDLKAIYEDEDLRGFIQNLLKDHYSVPQMRGLNLLIGSYVQHLRRVQDLNQSIYDDAKETVQSYLPAFEELITFLEQVSGDESDFENEGAEILNKEFIQDIADAVTSDNRVNNEFLLEICRNQEYRDELSPTLDSYPKVVHYIFGLADQLFNAKRCLEEIEIDEMLHDIEGQDHW